MSRVVPRSLRGAVGEEPTRKRSVRAPIDTTPRSRAGPSEFSKACKLVAECGILSVLQDRLDSTVGRPRSLNVQGLLVAMVVNGLRRHHQGTVAEVARVLNSFTPEQLDDLGVRGWNPKEAYDRADRLFIKLAEALESGWETVVDGISTRIDAPWFLNRMTSASLAGLPVKSKSVAIDGTDVETWGAVRWTRGQRQVDEDTRTVSGHRKRQGKLQVLDTDSDGREVYTADPDARAGHRSATNSRPQGEYIGYELHLGVQARDVVSSDGIERITLGPEVPPVITTVAFVPAGSHRADAIVPTLIAAKDRGWHVENVVWDRGYSQLRPETTSHPLSRAGIQQTFRPMETQRLVKPFSTDALIIEGQLFSAHMPDELRGPLRMPPQGSSVETQVEYEKAFNRRARFRFQRHAGPDEDGTTRWRCPYCSGFLRSRSLPKTMRKSRLAPLAELPEGVPCCHGTVSVSAGELPLWQPLPPGTTAWRISMGRRQTVEGGNAGLKGGFVNIQRKFFRVMGLAKMTVLLASTIVGYNVDRIRSFLARKAEEVQQAAGRPTRAKRRRGTWSDLLDVESNASGPDPPG
jgi:hypothetical protein